MRISVTRRPVIEGLRRASSQRTVRSASADARRYPRERRVVNRGVLGGGALSFSRKERSYEQRRPAMTAA